MSRFPSLRRALGVLALIGVVGGCEAPLPSAGRSNLDVAIQDTCRQRANQAYDRQNRAAIYAPQYAGNAPLSGAYPDVGVTRGLSAQFGFERMVRDCVRTASVTGSRDDAPVEPDAAPQATSQSPVTPAPRGTVRR